MTLFMGSKPNGDPLIHLTSGNEDGNLLRGDPISNSTLFHSDFPYITLLETFEITTCTRTSSSNPAYGFSIPESMLQQIEAFTNQGYFIVASRIRPYVETRNAPGTTGESWMYFFEDVTGFDIDFVTGRVPGSPGIAIENITGNPRYIGSARRPSAAPNLNASRWKNAFGATVTDRANAVKWGDQSIGLNGKNDSARSPNSFQFQRWSETGTGGVQIKHPQNRNQVGVSTRGYANSGNRIATGSVVDTQTLRNFQNRAGLWGIWGDIPNTYSAPSTLQWAPDGNGNPTLPINHPLKYGAKLLISVLNIRLDSNNQLTHVRPATLNRQLKVSRDELSIGNVDMSTRGILSQFPGANLAQFTLGNTFLLGRDRNNTLRGNANNPQAELNYYDAFAQKSLAEQGDIHQPGTQFIRPAPNNPRGNELANFSFFQRYKWGVFTRHFNVIDPRVPLGPNPTIRFDEDEISFANTGGTTFPIVSRATNFTAFRLGGSEAANITFPATVENYAQLTQNSTFSPDDILNRPRGGEIYAASPNPPGTRFRRQLLGSVRLPENATSGGFMLAYVTPAILSNARCEVNLGGKISRLDATTRPIGGIKQFQCMVIRENDNIEVANFAFAACRNVALSANEGYPQNNTSTNRWQGVQVRYVIQANFGNNTIELYREVRAQNQYVHFNLFFGPGTPDARINALSTTEVTYSFPPITVGVYPIMLSR